MYGQDFSPCLTAFNPRLTKCPGIMQCVIKAVPLSIFGEFRTVKSYRMVPFSKIDVRDNTDKN